MFACNKTSEYPLDQLSTLKEDPIGFFKKTDEAGKIHNQALDYAFNDFKDFVGNKPEDYVFKLEEIFGIGRNSSIDFLNNCRNTYIEEDRELAMDLFNSMFDDQRVSAPKPSRLIILASSSYSFSPKQLDLIKRMEETLDNDRLSLDETVIVFRDIRSEAFNSLPKNEATIVIAAIDIGIHSLTYWHNNISVWANLLGNRDPIKRINWKEVGAWDIAGAIGGGVGAAITGAGAIGGAIAGGVGTSLASAIYQLIMN